MRTPFVVGNWKLHKTVAEALALVTELKNQLGAVRDVAFGVAPPYTALWPVARRLDGSNVVVAGQDCFYQDKGAWTGAVGPAQLLDVGCTWVIIGHSERRQHFGETDATVEKKVRLSLADGLNVIGCVGETEKQRDAGETFAVVDAHLTAILAGAAAVAPERLVIAYEPVWAIGTGRTATPAQAQEVHAHIRTRLREKLGDAAARSIRIQYGGSVKASNAEALLREPDIDGALVGGASLDATEFVAIVKSSSSKLLQR